MYFADCLNLTAWLLDPLNAYDHHLVASSGVGAIEVVVGRRGEVGGLGGVVAAVFLVRKSHFDDFIERVFFSRRCRGKKVMTKA